MWKSSHIKENWFVDLTKAEANVPHEASEFQKLKWEQCLSIGVIDQQASMISKVHQTNIDIVTNISID